MSLTAFFQRLFQFAIPELDGALFELHTLDSGLPYLNQEELNEMYYS